MLHVLTGQGTNVKPQSPRGTSECLPWMNQARLENLSLHTYATHNTHFAPHHAIPIPDGIRSLEIASDPPRRRDAHVPDEWKNARDGRQGRPQDRECEGVILIRGRRRGDHRAPAVGVAI